MSQNTEPDWTYRTRHYKNYNWVDLMRSDETNIKRIGHVHHRHVWQIKKKNLHTTHTIPTKKWWWIVANYGLVCGSGMKMNGVMNSTKHHDISTQILVALAKRSRIFKMMPYINSKQHRND